MMRRKIVSPADMALGLFATVGGLFAWVVWVVVGEGFWSIGIPASIAVVCGPYIIWREWRRKP